MRRRLAEIAAETAIGVAQHQHRVGPLGIEQSVDADDHPADRLGGCVARGVEVIIGRSKLELLEEDRIELAIVVLGPYGRARGRSLDPAPRGLRDRRMTSGRVPTMVMTFRRFIGGIACVSGRSGSNCSLAHERTISSLSPTFVTSCAQPGSVSMSVG